MTEAMFELAPGAAADYEVELVPGVGHFIVDERPELVRDRVQAFLALEPA